MIMKRVLGLTLCLLAALFITTAPVSMAQNLRSAQGPATDVGLGGQICYPSGVTLKLYQRFGLAYEFFASWDLDRFFFLNGHVLFERLIPDSPLHYFIG